jgi:hypothetical protein
MLARCEVVLPATEGAYTSRQTGVLRCELCGEQHDGAAATTAIRLVSRPRRR